MSKQLTSIGLMSGTSLDGIDVSIIQSDGEEKIEIIGNYYLSYEEKFKKDLGELKNKIINKADLDINKDIIQKIESNLTDLHADSITNILRKYNLTSKDIDVVGFHGQTIYHSYKENISRQLGEGKKLNKLINISVIYNFRENDILNGGQGAPLTPIYHKALQKIHNLSLPLAFINIGGIANITYIDESKKITAFDSGPGNCLIDNFLQLKSNNKINFDNNGEIALKGSINEIILENYLNDPFYLLPPPKTLDVGDFSLSIIRGLNLEESVTTLSELTARTIGDSLNFFANKPRKLFLSGGGRKNKFLFKRIEELSNIETKNIDDLNVDGDYIESQSFAYLAIRSLLNKPISYPETTGVNKPCLGGVLIKTK
tara:strand:- start:717 stop:1832 length:1116 start_codon:yes stop_codon:yes gene_type:complete